MKICKQILSVVLTLALTLSLFGALTVSADTTAAVVFDIYEEVADEDAGINTLVFKASVPAGKYGSCGLLFSFDNTKVQLMDYETFEPVTEDADGTYYALEPISKWDYAPIKMKVDGDRTYVKADSYYARGTTLSSAGELEFTKVYFKYKDGAKPSKDTFKLESDYAAGSWLMECYPNSSDSTAAPISVFDSGSAITYTYKHATGTDATPIAVNSFEHSGTVVSTIRTVTVENKPAYSYEDGVTSRRDWISGINDTFFRYLVSKSILGITETVAANSVFKTKGTAYEGMIISGEIKARDNKIDTDKVLSNGVTYNIKNNEMATYIKFEGLEVSQAQLRASGNDFALEFTPAEIIAHATEWKAWDLETGAAVDMPLSELTEAKFYLQMNEWYSIDVVHTKKAIVPTVYEYDVAPFTSETKFVSMDASNMYIGSTDASKWVTLSANGFNVYRNKKITGVSNDVAGPYQVIVPNFSGTYRIYGLKYGHVTSGKAAKIDIMGNMIAFSDAGNSPADPETNSLAGFCTYWSKPDVWAGHSYVTVTAGEPILVMDTTINPGDYDEGAVLALAFVPVEESIVLNDSNRVIEDIMNSVAISALMNEDFVKVPVSTYNIQLKDSTEAEAAEAVEFTAKPLYRRSQFKGSKQWNYNAKSMLGYPTKYATAEDVLNQFLVETKGNAFADIETVSAAGTYQMYVNGIREYNPSQKLILPGDVVEIKKEAITSQNFLPLDLGANKAYNSALYRVGNGVLRFGLKASVINNDTYPYLYTGTNGTTAGTYPVDTFFAGVMTITKDCDYTGSQIYVPLVALESKNNDVSGNKQMFLPNIKLHSGNDTDYATEELKGIKTIEVETPEGMKTVADPYGLTTGNAGSWYNTTGLFWVNGSTTNDVRYEVIDGNYVIRTDGCLLIRVITKKADGSTKTDRAVLTPGKVYTFKPESGDTVYVWEDTAYAGSTMKPLLAPFVID